MTRRIPVSRWGRLMRKAGQLRLSEVLDSRPLYFFAGPVAVGRDVTGWRSADWGGDNQVNVGSVIDGQVAVGRGTRFGPHSFVSGPVRVGRYGSFGAHVGLVGGAGHPIDTAALYTSPVLFGGRRRLLAAAATDDVELVIGHDVWIGHGATVLGGVTVGDGSVVGANSVVTSDVAPFQVVAGSPARVIRPRFAPEIVELLEEWAWWDLDPDQLVSFEDILALDLNADPVGGAAALRAAIERSPEPACRPPEPVDRERFGRRRRAVPRCG